MIATYVFKDISMANKAYNEIRSLKLKGTRMHLNVNYFYVHSDDINTQDTAAKVAKQFGGTLVPVYNPK